MNELENRFDKEVENRKFNFLEMCGFKSKPNLAIKAGIAIGYQMAIKDIASQSDIAPNNESQGTMKECGAILVDGLCPYDLAD